MKCVGVGFTVNRLPQQCGGTRVWCGGEGIKTSESGIGREHVKVLSNFGTKHNHIRVLQISPAAEGHPFCGARLLLLDGPGNIQSVWFPSTPLTHTYLDVFATLPALIPSGPVAILGLGGGSTARLFLCLYPTLVVHAWEIDPFVLSVSRRFFHLSYLQRHFSNRFFVYPRDALHPQQLRGEYAGVVVNLVGKGCVVRQLQEGGTWKRIKMMVKEGGRIMANVGGSCLKAESCWRNGQMLMEDTLSAMQQAFPRHHLSTLSIGDDHSSSSSSHGGQNVLALTGSPPDAHDWSNSLPHPLSLFPHLWKPL